MTRHTYDPDYHRAFVEQHHLRPVDEATRTTPVFSRKAMGFPLAAPRAPTRRPRSRSAASGCR